MQVGWICRYCNAPGMCIEVDKHALRYPAKERGFSKPHDCPFKNAYTAPQWEILTLKELNKIVKEIKG